MITIVRTRTLRALRASITEAETAAKAARTDDSAIRTETALEDLHAQHAALTAAAARDAGELQTLRAQHLLDTEDRAVLRTLLRTARKTAAAQQHVFVLMQRGALHSVHATREDAEQAAERDGAHPDGWLTQGVLDTDAPAYEVAWRIQPMPIGTSRQ
ncbi:hypothetical protein [Streptomyces sp. AVP053U2]|uniref:hypothetical protein n=1 Tax=Streptomyces sp. AVP053U2 TaxID=1737066 RepID=UPI00073CAA98|nr:hypothetical protein [Streptomyces sp. AVP053U2]ODA69535.1 hypothetical protein APS67_006339 [Streptomyces sp. AVP053U2]